MVAMSSQACHWMEKQVFSAIMHKKIIPVFSPRIFPCIKIHIASRLRDLQSYHFDKTTESKQIHPYQGRLAVPGHLAVLAAAVVFVLGVSCAAAQWCQLWRFSNDNMKLFESLVSRTFIHNLLNKFHTKLEPFSTQNEKKC